LPPCSGEVFKGSEGILEMALDTQSSCLSDIIALLQEYGTYINYTL
jgi:hypothetical protein